MSQNVLNQVFLIKGLLKYEIVLNLDSVGLKYLGHITAIMTVCQSERPLNNLLQSDRHRIIFFSSAICCPLNHFQCVCLHKARVSCVCVLCGSSTSLVPSGCSWQSDNLHLQITCLLVIFLFDGNQKTFHTQLLKLLEVHSLPF